MIAINALGGDKLINKSVDNEIKLIELLLNLDEKIFLR